MTTATVAAPLCRNFINGRSVESRSGQTVERKATGEGLREMGRVAIDFYTEPKAVYIIDYTSRGS